MPPRGASLTCPTSRGSYTSPLICLKLLSSALNSLLRQTFSRLLKIFYCCKCSVYKYLFLVVVVIVVYLLFLYLVLFFSFPSFFFSFSLFFFFFVLPLLFVLLKSCIANQDRIKQLTTSIKKCSLLLLLKEKSLTTLINIFTWYLEYHLKVFIILKETVSYNALNTSHTILMVSGTL